MTDVPDAPAPRWRNSRIIFMRSRKMVLWLVFGICLGLLGDVLVLWELDRRAAVTANETLNAQDVAAHDGRIFIYYDIDRKRRCVTQVGRWLWTMVEFRGQMVPLYISIADAGSLAVSGNGPGQKFILSLELPAGLWPGEWHYLSRSDDYCSPLAWLFGPAHRETQSIKIDVEAARAQSGVPVTGVSKGKTFIRGRSPQ